MNGSGNGGQSPRPANRLPHSSFGKEARHLSSSGRHGQLLESPTPDNRESSGSVNVKLSQSGVGGQVWGLSRPSSPGHSPGVSPSHKRPKVVSSSCSPRSGSASEVVRKKIEASQQPSHKPSLEEMPKRAATPPLRNPSRCFSLAAPLKVPRAPVNLRLCVASPTTPDVEGRYLLSFTDSTLPKWTGSKGSEIVFNSETSRWEVRKGSGTPVIESEVVDQRAEVANASAWKTIDKESEASVVLEQEKCDISVIGDTAEFEEVLRIGVTELEEHIYNSLNAGYADNVGSMYRLPRRSSVVHGVSSVSSTETKTFEIGSYFRYFYEPSGLGWLDGRPAVLAALIYADRIRAHGRIISKRTVHRLLAAAVIVGHEYFANFMKDTEDIDIDPAPLHAICGMVDLTPEGMSPLILRFKGMMDFETAVIEQDVVTYVGGLDGGIELNNELRELAKVDRVPGQQGLSSRRDGMDAIRTWIDEASVSTNTPLDTVKKPQASPRKSINLHNLGGSASRAAVGALLKVHRSGGVTRLQSPIPVINHNRNVSPQQPPQSAQVTPAAQYRESARRTVQK